MTVNQSDFLVLYDAKMCNSNGDPNSTHNQPRYDYFTERVQVSSYAAKRYPREYAKSKGENILYQKYDTATLDLETAVGSYRLTSTQEALGKLYDVRMFGAPFAMKTSDKKRFSKVKGAVQIAEGQSLNRSEIVTAGLTSHLSSKAGKEAGTIGSYSFVKYAFIALPGNINANQAKQNRVTNEDIKLFDQGMTSGINEYKSQGKRNQNARMYIRIEYKDGYTTCLGDLSDYVSLTKQTNLHAIYDVELEIAPLIRLLQEHTDKIKAVHLFQHEHLRVVVDGTDFQWNDFFSSNTTFTDEEATGFHIVNISLS